MRARLEPPGVAWLRPCGVAGARAPALRAVGVDGAVWRRGRFGVLSAWSSSAPAAFRLLLSCGAISSSMMAVMVIEQDVRSQCHKRSAANLCVWNWGFHLKEYIHL